MTARLLALSVFLLVFSGCSHVCYLWQAGVGQLAIYNHERPLKEAIEDPRTPEKVRERLKWMPEIKKTVEVELGVKATNNYTTYVDLKRPYVTWALTAAEAYRLELVQWHFPIVGSFPYLGFFKEADAHRWAEDYIHRGYDTSVRGVAAYSTLGYLRDPLLSSMLSREKQDMVNLVFHETTHGQVYIKGEGSFNEGVASYIGDYGERAWIASTFGKTSAELKAWEAERADRRKLGQMLRGFSEELKKYYAASEKVTSEERKVGKDSRFENFRKRLDTVDWLYKKPARLIKGLDNNATFLAVLTYEDDQDLYDLLDKKFGGRLKDALQYLKDFADHWDRSKGATPQAALRDLLVRDAGRAVSLDVNIH